MSTAASWAEVKAKARKQDPQSDSETRRARRSQLREEIHARMAGARLAELRKEQGLTQVQLAAATGLSQARISQIENGKTVSLDVLRAYITGLGGQVEIVARIGPLRLDIA